MVWSVRLPRCSLIDGQQDQSCWDQGTQRGAFQDACLLHICPHIYSFSLLLMCFCETNPIFPLLYIQTFLNVDFLKFLQEFLTAAKISGIGRSWIFGRAVSWVQIICARLTLSRPPHTPRLTGGAGHQLDGIRLHFSSKSQPIRGCFYAEDNLAIGCKWKDGANALAPVRTAPKHQRLFSEKTLRKTLKDPGLLDRVHSLNQKIYSKLNFITTQC